MAEQAQSIRINFKQLNSIRFVDTFPGATVQAKLNAVIADFASTSDKGIGIIETWVGAGSPSSDIPPQAMLWDLRGLTPLSGDLGNSLSFNLADAGAEYGILLQYRRNNPTLSSIGLQQMIQVVGNIAAAQTQEAGLDQVYTNGTIGTVGAGAVLAGREMVGSIKSKGGVIPDLRGFTANNTQSGTTRLTRSAAGVFQSFSQPRTTITAASQENPTKLTSAGIVPATGDLVNISGATGAWAGLNGTWTATAFDSTRFTVPFDGTGLGALTGSVTFAGVVDNVYGFIAEEQGAGASVNFCGWMRSEVLFSNADTNGQSIYTYSATGIAHPVITFGGNLPDSRVNLDTIAFRPIASVSQTITAATNANPVEYTVTGAAPETGDVVVITGGTGNWNVPPNSANGTFSATKTGASTFTVPLNSTTFGASNFPITMVIQRKILFTNPSGTIDTLGLVSGRVGIKNAAAAPQFTFDLLDDPAVNDFTTTEMRIGAGSDGTLGPLLVSLQFHPSATGSSRFAALDVGDSVGNRDLCLLPISGASVIIGATSGDGNMLEVNGAVNATDFKIGDVSLDLSNVAYINVQNTFSVDQIIAVPGDSNDATHTELQFQSGADGTLGPLLLNIQLRPSATGASRYAAILAADNVGYRNIVIHPAGGAHLLIGTATDDASGRVLQVTGGIGSTGQIVSTIAGGTAPFIVTSQTQVTNLNASLLVGGDWASPGNIGSTVQNGGRFTQLELTNSSASVASGSIGLGASYVTTVGSAGAASAPPSAPEEYWVVYHGSNARKIPLYLS